MTDPSIHLGVKMSKRTLLSQVARFYDPIGFAAAFVIRAKDKHARVVADWS